MQGEDTLELHSVRGPKAVTLPTTHHTACLTCQSAGLRHGVPGSLCTLPQAAWPPFSTGTPYNPVNAVSIQCTSYTLNLGHPAREAGLIFLCLTSSQPNNGQQSNWTALLVDLV